MKRSGSQSEGVLVQDQVQANSCSTETRSSVRFLGWFTGFKQRNILSLCKLPCSHELTRHPLYTIWREERTTYSKANMDRTPLPFSFYDGETYNEAGARTVWVRGGASGMDKRPCTVQLTMTIFADEVPRVKPLIIFKGTGQRIPLLELPHYDPCVQMVFQVKAWCDEKVMLGWQSQWSCVFRGWMSIEHRRLTGSRRSSTLKTHPIYVTPGCTSIAHPLDVSFNSPPSSQD